MGSISQKSGQKSDQKSRQRPPERGRAPSSQFMRAGGDQMPDFRNLGVQLRLLLLINLLMVLAVLVRNQSWSTLSQEMLAMAARVELPLMLSALLLYLLAPLLRGSMTVARVVWCVLVAVAGGLVCNLMLSYMLGPLDLPRVIGWSAFAAVATLAYFWIQQRAYTPALAEARLMALTARIRPHFLFNSINAVLGTIRSDPRRAEQALEEMSDLFRALMRENTDLTQLGGEIALCRQYLELEKLRLGERLLVQWQVEQMPPEAYIPPLMLQPLLENAVYHGIEPGTAPGLIVVRIAADAGELALQITNPFYGDASSAGNRMALENIRERLMLFYDLEARLEARVIAALPGTQGTDLCYQVTIQLPLRHDVGKTTGASA